MVVSSSSSICSSNGYDAPKSTFGKKPELTDNILEGHRGTSACQRKVSGVISRQKSKVTKQMMLHTRAFSRGLPSFHFHAALLVPNHPSSSLFAFYMITRNLSILHIPTIVKSGLIHTSAWSSHPNVPVCHLTDES